MKNEKLPVLVLSAGAWICVLIESWLLLMRSIPADFLSWFFFCLFFLVAVMASAVANGGENKNKRGKLEVNFRGDIYSEDSGNLRIVDHGGKTFVWISETTPVKEKKV